MIFPYLYTDMSFKHAVILSILSVCTTLLHAATVTADAPADTIRFDDGAWYTGGIADSLFNGYGKMVYADSTIYEGEWRDGMWNGKGWLSYPDGDSYDGQFLDHEFCGYGTYIYSNGAMYEGYWQHGMFNGPGTMEYADGSTYAGNWKDDMKDGMGVFYDASTGTLMKGYFINDEFSHSVSSQEQETEPETSYSPVFPIWSPANKERINFHYRNDFHAGITYGSRQIFSIYGDCYLTDRFFAGATLGFNVIDYRVGKPSESTDDETGERITLVGWDDYPDEIMTETEYSMFRLAAECGYSWRWFSVGTAVGFGLRNTIRNCRSLEHNDSFFAPGTLYFREQSSSIIFNYDFFADFVMNRTIPFFHSCSLRAGWGKMNGLFMGLSVAF